MSKETRVYNPDEYSLSLFGRVIEGGFAEDEFLAIKQSEKDYTSVVGVDGSVTRSRSNNRMGEIVVSLMQTSPYNDFLSSVREDGLAGRTMGAGEVYVRDRNGTTQIHGGDAWIDGPPEQSYGRSGKERKWTIMVGHLDMFIGGNVLLV